MVKIRNLVLNTFQVNTYFISDESGECVIIDAACSDEKEEKMVTDLIEKNNLKLVRNLNTHCHIDHILGNRFIEKQFGLRPEYHAGSAPFFFSAKELAETFGLRLDGMPMPAGFLSEGMKIGFGNTELEVFYTPGHADGHVCFYDRKNGYVVTGDVLFKDTIGRTDLPTGDFDLLMMSIREKLFPLPDETTVYPGHGPATTIGYEKMNNPFIR